MHAHGQSRWHWHVQGNEARRQNKTRRPMAPKNLRKGTATRIAQHDRRKMPQRQRPKRAKRLEVAKGHQSKGQEPKANMEIHIETANTSHVHTSCLRSALSLAMRALFVDLRPIHAHWSSRRSNPYCCKGPTAENCPLMDVPSSENVDVPTLSLCLASSPARL